MQLLATARQPPSVHPADLRLALLGLSHPRPALLQPRRPAIPGARHRAAGSGAGRLWQAKGTIKGGTARDPAGHDDAGWPALPRGAAGLAPRRRRPRRVTELYYPGLQDPPP